MTMTKEMIDDVINGKNSDAADKVIELLYQKSIEQLDRYKKDYAAQYLNNFDENEPTDDEPTQEEQ